MNQLRKLYNVLSQNIATAHNAEELVSYFAIYGLPIVNFELQKAASPRFLFSKKRKSEPILHQVASDLSNLIKGKNYSANLDIIAKQIEDLRVQGLSDLADVSASFLKKALQLGEKVPADSHCYFELILMKCSKCGQQGKYLSWSIINTKIRDDLRQKVSTGEIFQNTCYYCSGYMPFVPPFIYCDPDMDEYLLLCPSLNDEQRNKLEEQVSSYIQELPAEFRGDKKTVAFANQYAGGFLESSGDLIMVSHIHDREQFLDIVNILTPPSITIMSDPLTYSALTSLIGNPADRAKDYNRYISQHAKAFLNKQYKIEHLREMSVALSELERSKDADFLRIQANRLEKKLRLEGIIRMGEVPNHLSNSDMSLWITQTQRVEFGGLPSEWGFNTLIDFVRGLVNEFDRN